jgi:hypothetical protein
MRGAKKYFLVLCLIGCYTNGFSQSKTKARYIGDYSYSVNVSLGSDTVAGNLFFTVDSFVIIYMIRHDIDFFYPLFKGTWSLDNDGKKVELKYDNATIKAGEFQYDDDRLFVTGNSAFYQNNDLLIIKSKVKK